MSLSDLAPKTPFSTPEEKKALLEKLLEDRSLKVLVLTEKGWKEIDCFKIEIRRGGDTDLGPPSDTSDDVQGAATPEEKRKELSNRNHHRHD